MFLEDEPELDIDNFEPDVGWDGTEENPKTDDAMKARIAITRMSLVNIVWSFTGDTDALKEFRKYGDPDSLILSLAEPEKQCTPREDFHITVHLLFIPPSTLHYSLIIKSKSAKEGSKEHFSFPFRGQRIRPL